MSGFRYLHLKLHASLAREMLLKVYSNLSYRVCTGPGKPGKSWNFVNGIFQDWKVLEKGH